jgi:hypothetical protein
MSEVLTVLQTSITAGNTPKDYQQALRAQLDTIKMYSDDLDKYTQDKLGSLQARPVISEVIAGVIQGIVEIWKSYRDALKETREATTNQLEKPHSIAFSGNALSPSPSS